MVIRRPNITVSLTQESRLSLIVAAKQHLSFNESDGDGFLLAQGEIYIPADSPAHRHTGTKVHFNFRRKRTQSGCMDQHYVFKTTVSTDAHTNLAISTNTKVNNLIFLGLPRKPMHIMADGACSVHHFVFTSRTNALVIPDISKQCTFNLLNTHVLQIKTPLSHKYTTQQ
ncbi:hypothetical protein V5799_017443 [Amblyomma americanum]|uniref:Uncharacterized protein n=1 Tax=Amblyomma americanum TaxID=6943 RepID=A0AAQ4F283_AMBAM